MNGPRSEKEAKAPPTKPPPQRRARKNDNQSKVEVMLREGRKLFRESLSATESELKQNLSAFESRFKAELVDQASKDKPNVLHLLARDKNSHERDADAEGFLKWVLKEQFVLLEKADQTAQTPLHVALGEANDSFVYWVLEVEDLPNIVKVLEMACPTGNCLHLAVQHGFPGLEIIVNKCIKSKQAFESQENKESNTPLHVAMRFDEEDEGVQRQLQRVLQELDTEFTRPRRRTKREGLGITNGTQPHPGLPSETRDIFNDHAEGDANGHSETRQSDLETVKLLIKEGPAALELKNKCKRTPYQEREYALLKSPLVNQLVKEFAGSDQGLEERARRSILVKDPIASYIRSYCMRNSSSREQIMARLYRPGQERHLEFDLAGMPTPATTPAYLNQLANHLKFESTLKYVALPSLTVETSKSFRRPKSRVDQAAEIKQLRKGRSDLVTIFDWLWANGVREIIKVMVVDDRDPPHADSAIIEALHGFKVEQWDWKRIDLCSDVIWKSSLFVKDISLYSSGNNAVMMGWASSEGLGNRERFPCLEKVAIFVREGLEDEETLNDFTATLERSIKSRAKQTGRDGAPGGQLTVRIVPDHNAVSFASEFRNASDYIEDSPPWIKCMEDFAEFLQARQEPVEPVKIAIIDDGIDAAMENLQSRIAGGATFCPYPHSSDFMNPYFVPSGKHGTLMAQMICNLCPDARLYIARLEELPAITGSGRRITAKSAAKAVEWAVDCGVDIITMSWTIEALPDAADFQRLKTAITKAYTANIVMLCSASDQGGHSLDRCFPGDWGMCLRIGAATFLGDKLAWVSETNVDFWFPGRNVPFKSSGDGKTVTYESGSSVATAAASGIAAVLIYASRLLGGECGEKSFRDRDAVSRAFTKMSSGTDRKFPRVHDTFSKGFRDRLRKADPDGPKKPDVSTLQWNNVTRKALASLISDIQAS